jgi:MFS superfamily sulfate permease-like transporter
LLTVKAIDMMDPWGRKSNPDRDLLAIGIGNAISALFGGLPMISEVARSAANVNNGARTRWSNFFHGFFLLFFLLTAVQFIELIPNTALAAMLISVGIKLAHPREFIHIFKIGKEQLAIFLVTILFTLIDDLLVGIAAGIVLNLIFHLIHGAPFAALFRIPAEVSFNDSHYLVRLHSAAIFSNYIGLKNILEAIPQGMDVEVDFSNVAVVDHTVQENLRHFQSAYQDAGGQFRIVGLGVHVPLSNHRTATRKKKIV